MIRELQEWCEENTATLALACWCVWDLAILLAHPAMLPISVEQFIELQNAAMLGMFAIILGAFLPHLLTADPSTES